MQLARYLLERQIKKKKFAELIGKSESFVRLLELGYRKPSLEVALKIADVTDGYVTPYDFRDNASSSVSKT